jgi:hypothetical protein
MIRTVLLALLAAGSLAAQIAPTRISVKMGIPVKPGPLTLLYPEWIPGEHGPTGPVMDLVKQRISGEGKLIPWRRDLAEMYTFQLTLPDGVNGIEIALDYIAAVERQRPWLMTLEEFYDAPERDDVMLELQWGQLVELGGGFSSADSTTDKLAMLSWNQMLLYPKGTPTDQLNYQADLKVPAGWRYVRDASQPDLLSAITAPQAK